MAHSLKTLKTGCFIKELGLYTEGFQVNYVRIIIIDPTHDMQLTCN